MAGYFDPQYGWVNAGGQEETMPLPSGLRRAADAVFNPGDPREEAAASGGQDPRFRFEPAVSVPAPALPTGPSATLSTVPSVMAAPSPVIHESGYRPDSFPAGDIHAGFSIDRSRGSSGMDWANDINRRHGDSEVVRAPDHVGAHTQGELEGMANARRLLDSAYGPTNEPFDPVAAEVEALNDQAKLKLAAKRAEDPIAFAREQAMIPAQAQTEGRLAGGERLATIFGGYDKQLQEIEQKRAVMHASPQYQAATPQARKLADERLDAEAEHTKGSLRVMQQAMGFAVGQTPASLYAEQLGR